MDNHSSNSRNSSRHSKSVVFPRIKTNKQFGESSHENTDFKRHINSNEQRNDFNNKHILERLDFVERALETERRDRNVLEDHVRALTANLQRLSKDMAALQQQLKSGENNVHSQSMALKNLELHQVSGIGDVWNRLTMGDLNTIKLSGDLNKLSGEVADLRRWQEHSNEKLKKLSKDVESTLTKIEGSSLEFEKNFQVLKVELDSRVTSLEQNNQILERSKHPDENNYSKEEMKEYSQVLNNYKICFDQFVEKHDLWKKGIEKKILSLEEHLEKVKGATSINYEDLTRRVDDVKTNQKKVMERSHETLKDSYREAFRAVYESITTMQTVLETKLKMTEADLKTSINSIMKTISK